MQAGKLRNRITVQRLKSSATADAGGHIDESLDANWEAYWTCWSNIIPRSSREFFGADRVQAETTHQIEIRYCSDAVGITSAMRVKYGTRTFNILSEPYDVDERRIALRFDAKEVR